jgi:ABC-type transport system involved in multi-copper enzyme maturation permease subunit
MTARQFLASVHTNLVFYRRNRLLVLAGLVVLLALVISIISSGFTASDHFDLIQGLVSMIEGFTFVFTAILGLVAVSHHVRTRSVKLVLTRPFSLGGWVLSHFASAVLVVLVLHLVILIVAVILFFAWDLPFQWGLLVDIASSVLTCLTVFVFMQLLSTLVHPAVGAVIAVIFNPSSVHAMLTMIEAPRRFASSDIGAVFYQVLSWLLTGLYYLLPEYMPFGRDLQTVFATYRVTRFDLPYIVLTVLYTTLTVSLYLMLTTVVLRRKRLI